MQEPADVVAVPQRAAGLELLGRADGSGYVEPPYLLRRGDGRVVEVSPLVYHVVAALDGRRDLAAIAGDVTASVGKRLRPEHVAFVIDHKLRPLGLVHAEGETVTRPARRPLLGVTVRTAVVPSRVVRALTTALRPLFEPAVIVAVLTMTLAVDVWLFRSHGLGEPVRQALYQPVWLLVAFGLTVVGGGFHELGHATGARYGGAEPGRIGVGFYLVWPVFFNDVTDSYRLGRAGRLRADLGGVYFNAVYVALLAVAWVLTGLDVLLVVILGQHVAALHQLLPFVRFDGYYVLSDVTGVPDLFARVRPLLGRVRRRPARDLGAPRLRPGVQAVVTAWVALTVPVLAAGVAALAVRAPHVVRTAEGSLRLHLDQLVAAWRAGDAPLGALTALQLAVLAVPFVGTTVLITRAVGRLVAGVARRHAVR